MVEHVSESKPSGKYLVHKHSVAGTKSLIVYAVYELTTYFGPHSTVMTLEGRLYGKVPTRELPKEIDDQPHGWKRSDALVTWRQLLYEECYQVIRAVYPETAAGIFVNGDIETGSW